MAAPGHSYGSPIEDPKFWVAASFVLFLLIFGRRIWAALSKLLDDRAARIRADLAEADRLRREAETMLREAEAARARALEDAKTMLARAEAEAAAVTRAAAAEAEAATARRERMAADRIAAAEKAALDEVRTLAATIAVAATERVLASGVGADPALVDRAISGLPAALTRRAA
jgi:F-type H+-transporting ATPase subunit b